MSFTSARTASDLHAPLRVNAKAGELGSWQIKGVGKRLEFRAQLRPIIVMPNKGPLFGHFGLDTNL